MIDTQELARLTEERLINLWPAVSTLMIDGWSVRFANGYSARANSASALTPGATLNDGLRRHIERLYREAGLPPCFRITPVADAAVEPMLISAGYRLKDESLTMTASLTGFSDCRPAPSITIEHAPGRRWLAGVSARQEASKRSVDHLSAIVGQIRLPAGFATLRCESEAVGFGMTAIDRGWAEIGSVMLDAGHRGKGHGRALVEALLIFAANNAAGQAFLQVTQENAVARSLYRSLGFEDRFAYRTYVLDH
ncbi:MAG: GNAT family N-acetyltransferase [Beijerinckiaceae bacterium]